jgi:hypothetical protein
MEIQCRTFISYCARVVGLDSSRMLTAVVVTALYLFMLYSQGTRRTGRDGGHEKGQDNEDGREDEAGGDEDGGGGRVHGETGK